MSMRGIAAVLLTLLLGACSSTGGDQVLGTRATSPVPTPSPVEGPEPTGDPLISFPPPNEPVPSRAKTLASEIRTNESKLERAIEMWLDRGGDRKSRAGHRVALGALWQQRMYRTVTKEPRLARSVIAKLPKTIARKVAAHVEAGAGLRALASPIEPPVRMRITPVDRHDIHTSAYERAGRRYDIPAEILASSLLVVTLRSRGVTLRFPG